MCRINNHKETPEDHLNSFERKPKASDTEPQFYIDKTSHKYRYIKNTIKSLKQRLRYYENSISSLHIRIDDLIYDNESEDVGELMAIESSLQQQLADANASRFWIDDQIDTLEKILDL